MRFYPVTLIIISTSIVHASNTDDRALSVYNGLKGKFDNAKSISENLQKPLTTGSSMTTLDGGKSFNAQFSCGSESEFLSVHVSSGSTNDVDALIKIDTDFDNSYDITHVISGMSSICKNGFVRCDLGTLDNCQYYELSANPNITQTPLLTDQDKARLFGCTCYNNSCGNDLFTSSADEISANLATTFATMLSNHNPRYIASRLEKSAFTSVYYGQDVTSCAAADSSGASTISDFASAKKNDDSNFIMSSGVNAVQTSPAGSPLSILNTAKNNALLPQLTEQTCTINRVMSYTSEPGLVDEQRASFSMFAQGRNWVRCTVYLENGISICGTDGENLQTLFTDPIDIDEMCGDETTVSIESEQWWTGAPGSWGPLDTTVNIIRHRLPTCDNGLVGEFEVRDRSGGSGQKWYLARTFNFLVSKPSCIFQESISNSCDSLNLENCTLYDESIDGTKTVSNSFSTGLSPSPTGVTVSNSNCSSFQVRDWHSQTRTYQCESPPQTFNPNLSHLTEPTINGNEATININGQTQTLSRPEPPASSCQASCEVQSFVLDQQTNIDGQASDARIDPNRVKKVIKSCFNNTCPINSGETIIKECSCSNSFGKAASALQMLRLAGQDFICTTGTNHTK